ncbi:MAG: type IV toxin-antitoxin system AbiEi family antitoxin domain-containing protein [Thermodesulfobacteriota bacterium]
MKYTELRKLREVPYFTPDDVAELLNIKSPSAAVLCVRYTKKGLFTRLKKNFYVLKERWQQNSYVDLYRISNILQVPSYISMMTALSFYEVTTQVQRDFFEAMSIKKTVKYEIESISFKFYKIKKSLYFDFIKMDDFFIATKEKAFMDAIYLYSFGKYTFDLDSIDLKKLDFERLSELLEKFPEETKKIVKRICKIY